MGAPRRRVIVIGAGLGGLAAAIHLLRQDLDVTVLERQPDIGGRASRLAGGGYTFDMGPAMITMPSVLEGLFAVAGARFEARVSDNHHHVICRVCGRTADVDCAVGSAPCLTAVDELGYEIDEAEVIYWGRCPECRSQDPR